MASVSLVPLTSVPLVAALSTGCAASPTTCFIFYFVKILSSTICMTHLSSFSYVTFTETSLKTRGWALEENRHSFSQKLQFLTLAWDFVPYLLFILGFFSSLSLLGTFCMVFPLLWTYVSNFPAIFRQHFFVVIPCLLLLQSVCIFWGWDLVEGVWYGCSIYDRGLHNLLFSTFWLVSLSVLITIYWKSLTNVSVYGYSDEFIVVG